MVFRQGKGAQLTRNQILRTEMSRGFFAAMPLNEEKRHRKENVFLVLT